ncbi:MAG: phosphatidylserine/phosphatidylglycerophosphate/cardiolipin synthase family protein [Chloroflexi bacterium]|nr:phosphatidylserine/phosphatidylglycerophosphate/cardiolipin synthase family protein [Chloroflexota bacterium]
MNRHTYFPKVETFYASLVERLADAQAKISMTYLAFEEGLWAQQIMEILRAKSAAGLCVQMMVDELGQQFDEPRRLLHNHEILARLRAAGVDVEIFRPSAPSVSIRNRMHCKFTAIDDHTAFIGGSNIADYYTAWADTNMRVDGDLGDCFHRTFEFLRGFSRLSDQPRLDPFDLQAGTDRLCLTLPNQHPDIRAALLNLIHSSDQSLHLRTWYFLPDAEILEALCERSRRGVQVNLMFSHQTRVRAVDFANHIPVHRLIQAGVNVYRYTGTYLHSKVAWNDHGDILLGSANLDAHSMHINFESCLQFNDLGLAWELRRDFVNDIPACILQVRELVKRRSISERILSHTCNLAAPWL